MFIEFNIKLFKKISIYSLLLKMFELCPFRKDLSLNTNYQYIYKFLKRNVYSFRTETHYGQILPDNCFCTNSLFLNEVINLRLEYRFSNASIANLDETQLFFNMGFSKTIAKKGIKQVII